MNEYEAALRRAFVDRRCDFIMIDSRRQEFQIKSANYGIEQGWIVGEWNDLDDQSTYWTGRLTEAGKKHFGLLKDLDVSVKTPERRDPVYLIKTPSGMIWKV